jgi:hypothetical protein
MEIWKMCLHFIDLKSSFLNDSEGSEVTSFYLSVLKIIESAYSIILQSKIGKEINQFIWQLCNECEDCMIMC